MSEPSSDRAQGTLVVPYPTGIIAQQDTCVVAVEVIVARERRDGAVYPEQTIPRVACGPAAATLEQLVRDTYPDGDVRQVLLFEIRSLGTIDPRCPLRLERRLVFDHGQREFIEALILPCGSAETSRVAGLLSGPGVAQARHEAAIRYARSLEARWSACCPAGRLPVRYLRQDLPSRTQAAAITTPASDPAAPDIAAATPVAAASSPPAAVS